MKTLVTGVSQNLGRLFVAFFCSFIYATTAVAVAQDLDIGNYNLVGKTRVSRVEFDYTYTAQVTNTGSDYQNVAATLTSTSPHTIVIGGELNFGDVASGDTALSQNTFTIRQNRRYPFSWDNLQWQFTNDEVVGDVFWVGPGGGTYADSNGTLISVPPGALTEDRMISVLTHLNMATLSAPAPQLGGALFGPSGLVFSAPISVTFTLNQEYPPGTELPIFTFNDDIEAWSATEFVATVNTNRSSATAELTHFTDYIVMGEEWDEIYGVLASSFFNTCSIQDLNVLYDDFKTRVLSLFPIGDSTVRDFSAHFPDYGYGCYEITGVQFVLHATRNTFNAAGEPIPFDTIIEDDTVGSEGGYISFYFNSAEFRQSSSSACGEYEMTYTADLQIHMAPRAPESTLEIDDTDLCVGETTNLKATLSCGGEPYENTLVKFTGDFGTISPDEGITDATGVTPVSVYLADLEEGEQKRTDYINGRFDAGANINIVSGPGITNLTVEPVPITVEACPYVEVVPATSDLYVDNSKGFTALLKRADGEEIPNPLYFTWQPSNASIGVSATPPNTAVVTGLVPGPVTLKATTRVMTDNVLEPVSGEAAIEVLPFDFRVEISPSTACLTIGETVSLSATVLDVNDTPQFDWIYNWSSSDENVVSVDPITGVALGIGDGSASISVTATMPDGASLSDFIEVSVGYAMLEPKDLELGVHGGYQFKATALDKDVGTPILEITPYVIPWEFGSPGGAIIIPYSDPNFHPALEDPTYFPYSDPDASYKLISWSSSDESVATVNKYGHVHGVSAGQAVISAALLPGSDVEELACATVDVVQKPAIDRQASFHGEAKNCYFGNGMMPGGTSHPFTFKILCDPIDNVCAMDWGGGGNGIAVLPSGTNISLIKNPAEWGIVHPSHTEFGLALGFKILLWTPETYSSFTSCGGHRYAGVQHTGFEWILRNEELRKVAVFDWYLFENYLDVPEGFHLGPTRCVDDDSCLEGSGAIADPDWDADPTFRWWDDYGWLWD